MFDTRQTQINESYLGTADTAIQTSRELSKSLINVLTKITKVILEKLKEAQEASKIAVEVGKDIYNLVPDESTPGAYKWEKVDLTSQSIKSNQETNIVLMPDFLLEGQYTIETEPFTDYQAQTIAARLVEDVLNLNSDYQQTSDNALKITAYLESDGSEKQIVIYEQNSEGKCTTNLVTEILTPDEIIDVASEPLVKLLPPSADIINNHKDTKELLFDNGNSDVTEVTPPLDNLPVILNEDNQQLNFEIVTTPVNLYYEEKEEETAVGFIDDIDISNPPGFDSPPDVNYYQSPVVKNYPKSVEQTLNEQSETNIQAVESNTSQQLLQDENSENSSSINQETNLYVEIEVDNSFEDDVVNNLQEEIAQSEETIQIRRIVTSNHQSQNQADEEVNENVTSNQFFAQEPEEQATNNRKKYASEFTYQEVANSQDVESAAQQWARQVEVPIYQINNKQAREERYNGENKDIAETAIAMLKKYGTLEQDGSRIYRSDTFVIRQQGDTVSIHRRSDELFGWENSLMDFKLNKKEEPKITKKPTEMLPVERQEFLIVAEYLSDNGKLPDLNNADIRDVANSLGSLAPAGTIKTLEVFKQNEMLHTLNNVLIQADKEELTVGEFTIKRSRNPEKNRASLQLFKTTEEKGTQELVRFDLTKTEAGITKEVSKMNISEYDINQIKFIAQNASKLNLEQIFGNEQSTSTNADAPKKRVIQAVGDLPVTVHPYIAEEWANMVKHGGPDWGGAMNQGNEEILQRINENNGKLPIADQREMYFKIMTYKATEAQKQGETVVDFVPLKDIMNDLQVWRGEEIRQQYTPTEHIPSPQKQTVAATPKTKSREVEL
ncbi:hypothetical protein [Nostoc sp. 106C]|uniref:hypothetical protein n=1 Tax=Nostoc sp. 106C TaxID=1932667 RepID=UPI000A3A89C2|nr:hypothetical protein [Nostoc sp. 106C]OUL28526.1 hypothetical protein BV375_17645 [Nostoc sp. 106C]